jgi:adenosylcobinamide-GDP ribazoletransferase
VNALRLSVGLLTVIPAGRLPDVDRRAARGAMLLAPVVGLLLGVIAAAVIGTVDAVAGASAYAPLLASILAVALLAYLTRALHLDGLADTADALGSGRRGEDALEIARRGDVGPFGVTALVLVLLIQVSALAVTTDRDVAWAAVAVVVAVVAGRCAATLACMSGIPAARPEGLGALVAGTVPRMGAITWTVALLLAAGIAGAWLAGIAGGLVLAGATSLGLLVGLLLARRAVRRLGGITGDVLGAAVEAATTTTLLAIALGSSVAA